MRPLTFRAKLFLIMGSATFSLSAVVVGSAISGLRATQHLEDVEGRLVPKLELGPRLEREFDALNQGMAEAVAAQDGRALEETVVIRNRLLQLVARAGPELEPASAVELRWALDDYYDLARSVSARSIAGEAGEALVNDLGRMQQRRASLLDSIKKSTGLNRRELRAGFAAVREANQRADTLRLSIGLTGLLCVVGLSIWAARRMLGMVARLSTGLSRFATGDFSQPIVSFQDDELGRVAALANQMAESLRHVAEQRASNEWVEAGLREISDELRGELEPEELARRALAVLARRVQAYVGAFYRAEEPGFFRLLAELATEGVSVQRSFRVGEGLLGEAARQRDLRVLRAEPESRLRLRSGLSDVELHSLVLFPVWREGAPVALIELGLRAPCRPDVERLLVAAREGLAISLLAAQSRAVLTERNAELEQARSGLQQKAEELARVSAYKSQFLANMSHELRTPLNSMLLLSHLLAENEEGNLSERQVLHCKTIHSAGQDLLKLINQVLDLARIEAGREEVQLEDVALRDFIAYARKVFEPLASDKRLGLSLEIEAGMPDTMYTDRQRVERILTNLLGNAIKFTDRGRVALIIGRPRPGTVFSNARLAQGRAIAFSVSDTGIGIAPEARARLFTPFEQLGAKADERRGGSGLGLAISRDSAVLLGGELVFESAPGGGSVFRCHLPENSEAHSATARASASVVSTSKRPAALAVAESPLLLIEDDALLADQITAIVRARNLEVLVAKTGAEGLRLAREWQPRGVILDVKLPDIDGWAVLERLRSDPATRGIPVHIVSGVDAVERGLSLGAVGYLTKPATHAELSSVVRTLLGEPEATTRVLVVEDSEAEGQAILAVLSADGIRAEHVTTAAEALARLQRERFGCVILDLGLPDMDGRLLLDALPTSSHGATPRIVVHTGRNLERDEQVELESKAQAIVAKDGSSSRLLEEVRQLRKARPEAAPRRESHSRIPLEQGSALSGVHVLVAEDDMRTAYALSASLGERGAEVFVADNGRSALELLAQHPEIRIVLMDVTMPEMDGYEAMTQLRADKRFRDLPIIALTARAMAGERERCLEAGASDYLTKPVDHERLFATLCHWLTARDSAEHPLESLSQRGTGR